MRTLLYILLLLGVTYGCNKFEYPEQTNNCSICEYAESMNGTYKGLAHGVDNFQYIASGTYSDSLDINLEHIFLDLGPKIDSTVMFFKRTRKYHSVTSVLIDTIAISDVSGSILNPPYDTCKYTPNTITLYHYVHGKQEHLEMDYIGFK